MTRDSIHWGLLLALAIGGGAACSSDPVTPPPPPPPPPPSPTPQCGSVAAVQLAAGGHRVIDPAQSNGCVRVPQAGGQGAEFIVVVASTASNRTTLGVSGPYFIRAANPGATTSAMAAPNASAARPEPRTLSAADRFHDVLRARERELAADPANRTAPPGSPAAAVPPPVGDVKVFKTCANLLCSSFNDVTATARFVGTKAAIYVDNTVPTADPLQDPDFQELARTFDTYHYPIDLAAFGAESDVDNNERIVILMTDAVNSLTPNCSEGRVLGYFFGLDLVLTGPNSTNSNKAEIFYTLVPQPATSTCTALSRTAAVNAVKPTLIHELQHMISWNQHVLVRGGSAEETWLNEALSHFAEELGGRKIPEAECTAAGFVSCRSQYISGDIINAHDFLQDPEASFLIYPTSSNGTLEERGASWHFLRWVLDQFSTDTIFGSDKTPALIQTAAVGVPNLTSGTGGNFSDMVVEWLLSAFLDDLSGFTGSSPRLRFRSWGLRSIWTDPRNAQIFPNGFPLKPDSTSGAYTRSGTLRGGSGRHLRLIQAPNGPAIDVQVVRTGGGEALDAALVARIGIARVR